MKTSSRRTIIGVAVIFVSSIAFSGVFAEQGTAVGASDSAAHGATQKKSRKGGSEGTFKNLTEPYHATMKTYMDQKRNERQAFKESLKDKSSEEKKTLIEQFHTKQASEMKAFIAQQRSDLTSKIQNSNIPDDKKSELLAKMQERFAKADAHIEKQMQENKQAREQALSDGSVSKEEKTALNELNKAQRKENKEFLKSQKSGKAQNTGLETATK